MENDNGRFWLRDFNIVNFFVGALDVCLNKRLVRFSFKGRGIMIAKIQQIIAQEPVAISTVILALAEAIIGVLVAFNVGISPEQQTSILALIGSLVTITVALGAITRSTLVTPVANPKNMAGEKLVPEVEE